MQAETKNWLIHADEHFANMQFLFKNRRYGLAVFCAHQTLEMILKGAIVEMRKIIPPKSHNLDHLLTVSQLVPPDKSWYENLAAITKDYWKVRYPDYRIHVYKTKEKVAPTIEKAEEIYLWIKNKLKTT